MARWRLTAPHYLNVEGTEWLQEETDRETGRRLRKMYPVPLHLDPKNPKDWNYPEEVIICYAGKGQRKDYVFDGKPTPDMEPLDDEAKAISDAESPKWVHPIDSLPTDGAYGDALVAKFEAMMTGIMKAQGGPVSAKQDPQVAELLQRVAELTETVAILQARVVDKDEPLPEAEPTPEEIEASQKAADAAAAAPTRIPPVARRA